MYDICYGGRRASEFGVCISDRPDIPAAKKKMESIEIAGRERNEEAFWSLNTDAHLRSVIMGRSETVPVVDGNMILGEFGRIYFADFDQVRARKRVVQIQIMGE